jgi:hypothetical protein
VSAIKVGVNGDKIGYWCNYHMIIGIKASTDRRAENSSSYRYIPRISLRDTYYMKFCSSEQLLEIAEIICAIKGGSVNDEWRKDSFNICTLAVAHAKGRQGIERAMSQPDMCALCEWSHHIPRLLYLQDRYETRDLTCVQQYATNYSSVPTRRVYWSLKHDQPLPDDGDGVFSHASWLWGHPHYFEYDLERYHYEFGDYSQINRLELDCLIECSKLHLKWKYLKGTEFRCKTLYQFPGPPSKLGSTIQPAVWEEVLSTLFALCTGLMSGERDVLLNHWRTYGQKTGFEAALLRNELWISDRINVEYVSEASGLRTVDWPVHQFSEPEEDALIADILHHRDCA